MVEEEPTRGSVVMVYGPSGTAFQRFFSDGQWHGTNGEVCSWGRIMQVEKAGNRAGPLLILEVKP
jgi:hypothetical protein